MSSSHLSKAQTDLEDSSKALRRFFETDNKHEEAWALYEALEALTGAVESLIRDRHAALKESSWQAYCASAAETKVRW